jgi:hypothetical protein
VTGKFKNIKEETISAPDDEEPKTNDAEDQGIADTAAQHSALGWVDSRSVGVIGGLGSPARYR